MAQRNSAGAGGDAAAHPPDAAGPTDPEALEAAAHGAERRRAAAYLDLWERQLRHVAAHGPATPPAGDKRRPG